MGCRTLLGGRDRITYRITYVGGPTEKTSTPYRTLTLTQHGVLAAPYTSSKVPDAKSLTPGAATREGGVFSRSLAGF